MKSTQELKLKVGGKTVRFLNKGRKAVDLWGDGEEFACNADIKLADGTMVDGIVFLDATSSFEHGGTMIFIARGIVEQGKKGFLTGLCRTKEQIFPYKYRVRNHPNPYADHHTDGGWSQ